MIGWGKRASDLRKKKRVMQGNRYAAKGYTLSEAEAVMKLPPYGPMCRNPAACKGIGYCPLDPTCGD